MRIPSLLLAASFAAGSVAADNLMVFDPSSFAKIRNQEDRLTALLESVSALNERLATLDEQADATLARRRKDDDEQHVEALIERIEIRADQRKDEEEAVQESLSIQERLMSKMNERLDTVHSRASRSGDETTTTSEADDSSSLDVREQEIIKRLHQPPANLTKEEYEEEQKHRQHRHLSHSRRRVKHLKLNVGAEGKLKDNWLADHANRHYVQDMGWWHWSTTGGTWSRVYNTREYPESMYQRVRWGSMFGYTIPVQEAGKYLIRLHFCETVWWYWTGRRQFNVDIQGVRELTNYDIAAQAGGTLRAHRWEKIFEVTEDNKQISIVFSQGASELPTVSGIEIHHQPDVPCTRTISGSDYVFNGCNVHIVNGESETSEIDGTGNLIIGKNDCPSGLSVAECKDARKGSHNLVVGEKHSYESYGGIVAGKANGITKPYASVLGGIGNFAKQAYGTIVGGKQNEITSNDVTTQTHSVIVGGVSNKASASAYSVVVGGTGNKAQDDFANVHGGHGNTADADQAGIHGGVSQTISTIGEVHVQDTSNIPAAP